jgi:hypothetical protein
VEKGGQKHIKKQNYNPKIKKLQQLVILSETKNLGCDAVSSVLWPDPSAAPQDDRKTPLAEQNSGEIESEFHYNLKKQSQFLMTLIGIRPYIGDSYENKPACGVRKNKANSKPNKANCRPSAGNSKH